MLIARLVLHCQQVIVVNWNGVDCSSDLYTKNLPRKDLRNIQEHKIHVHWIIVMLSQLESVRGSVTRITNVIHVDNIIRLSQRQSSDFIKCGDQYNMVRHLMNAYTKELT